MSYTPPGTLRVLGLFARTAVLRLFRAAAISQQKRNPRWVRVPLGPEGPNRQPRQATRRKPAGGLTWLMVLLLPALLLQALLMSSQTVACLGAAVELRRELEQLRFDAAPDAGLVVQPPLEGEVRLGGRISGRMPGDRGLLQPARRWSRPEARDLFVRCGSVLLLALSLLLLAFGFGGAQANLAGGAWTQAWLLTFPVATRSLLLARVLEYALVQLAPWLFLTPLLWQLLRALGQPLALPLAASATLTTMVVVGSVRLWLETRLRLSCTLKTLRSVQGAFTLVALALMATVLGACLGTSTPGWLLDVGAGMPTWLVLLPASWPLAMGSHGFFAVLCGIGVALLLFAGAIAGSSRLLAHGAMRSGGVDSGQRGRAGLWQRTHRLSVVGKDLALLLRDRNFLVQAVCVPVVAIGLQLVVNPGLNTVAGRGVVMLAYGIGLYGLIGGCFQVLGAEGRALWMLYSLPVPVAAVLRQKVRIWATLAISFAWIALVAFALRGGPVVPTALLLDALLVGFGLWCAAHIAAGISVIGADPNADHVPWQPKARHIHLYFLLASTFFVGLATRDLAPRFAAMAVFGTLAYAVWQRACDRLPWLLDPVDEPRREVALFDGSAALLVFFVLQAFATWLLLPRGASEVPSTTLLLAFVLAGGLTVLMFLIVLASRGVDVGEALLFGGAGQTSRVVACATGIAVGAGLGLFGLGYSALVRSQGWSELPALPSDGGLALALLAVLAAPVVEEVLFRGLVFGGLVRSVGLPLAVLWSAGLFAAVHPAVSWLPVGLMGAAAALLLHRTRFLPAAMLLHASYNFVVVTWQ